MENDSSRTQDRGLEKPGSIQQVYRQGVNMSEHRLIPLSPYGMVALQYSYLGCPTCKSLLYDKGYGFAVCEKCDSIMLHKSGVKVLGPLLN